MHQYICWMSCIVAGLHKCHVEDKFAFKQYDHIYFKVPDELYTCLLKDVRASS